MGSGEHLGNILVKGICVSFPLTARKLSSIPRKVINDSTRKPKAYEFLLYSFPSSSYLWMGRLFTIRVLAWDSQNSRNLPGLYLERPVDLLIDFLFGALEQLIVVDDAEISEA